MASSPLPLEVPEVPSPVAKPKAVHKMGEAEADSPYNQANASLESVHGSSEDSFAKRMFLYLVQ